MSEENSILVDWFSATTKLYDVPALIAYLGFKMSDFEPLIGRGRYFFSNRWYCGGISILSDCILNPEDEHYCDGVMIEMSGKGCRQFEQNGGDFNKLFTDSAAGDFKVTRLDIAYDDIDKSEGGKGLLDIATLARYTIHQRFVTKWGGGYVTDSFKVNGNEEPMVHALTVSFGSNSSDCMLRIYDKAQERGGLDYHWIRSELVFRRERAQEFINQYVQSKDVGSLYFGVLKNYLRFIRKDATRRERCSTVGWWEKFLNNVQAVRLFTPHDNEYNLEKVRRTVVTMYGNSIETLVRAEGPERFLEDIMARPSKLNVDQRQLLAEQQQKDPLAKAMSEISLDEIFKKFKK